MTYDEMRADVEETMARHEAEGAKVVWKIAGVSFVMEALKGAETKFCVNGKRCSEAFYVDALSSVLPSSTERA